jgi:hypothetical protein
VIVIDGSVVLRNNTVKSGMHFNQSITMLSFYKTTQCHKQGTDIDAIKINVLTRFLMLIFITFY